MKNHSNELSDPLVLVWAQPVPSCSRASKVNGGEWGQRILSLHALPAEPELACPSEKTCKVVTPADAAHVSPPASSGWVAASPSVSSPWALHQAFCLPWTQTTALSIRQVLTPLATSQHRSNFSGDFIDKSLSFHFFKCKRKNERDKERRGRKEGWGS